VQNWIDIVATMNDPKAVSATDIAVDATEEADAPVEAAADAFMGLGMDTAPF
jgi:hypothetical protein